MDLRKYASMCLYSERSDVRQSESLERLGESVARR